MERNNILSNLIKYPLTICFFIFILLISVLYLVFPTKEMSEWENRYLAKCPEVRLNDVISGSFMSKYEDYINDQIPFRDAFIKTKAVSETMLLKIENNSIVKGRESMLFTKNTGDSKQFDKNIEIISGFIEKLNDNNTNVKTVVAIAPNACAIYEDRIPKGFPCINQKEKLSQIEASNSLLKGARVVDLNSALSAHEDEYIYYRTDHHWTSLGAYYAYCEISENPVNKADLKENIYDGFYGTLYAKYKGLFVKADSISYYDIPVRKYTTDGEEHSSLYDTKKLSEFDKYAMFMHGNFGRCDIETQTDNGKSVIIFKDSYANCLIPYLTYDYENITVIDLRFFSESVSELIRDNKDADFVFLYNFDFLNDDNHFYKLMK